LQALAAGADYVSPVDIAEWIERVEAARQTLGWSQRRLAREAGLGNEGNYGVLVQRIRAKTSESAPAAQTVSAINSALARAGAAVQHEPELPPAPARTVEYDDRFAGAREVVQALVEDGYDKESAKRAVGSVAFDEGAGGSNPLHLFRAAKRILDTERGRPEVGVRERRK
jgi:transcriptional regulator with XRE-family HTH domain